MKVSITGFVIFLMLSFSSTIFAQPQQQGKCFTEAEAKKLIDSINAELPKPATENKKLREQLLKMQDARRLLNQKISENWEKSEKLIAEANQLSENQMLQLCGILKEHGWLTKDLIGEDAVASILFLIRNNKSPHLQRELFPVLLAATEKGYIGKGNLASVIDNIRVGAGMPQIFGTQTYVKDETFYLYPILNEERVDKWRALYNLPPLAAFIKEMEVLFQSAVIKSPRLPVPPVLKQAEKPSAPKTEEKAAVVPGIIDDENEVLTIETRIVNLNVRVLNEDLSPAAGLNLKKEDFAVFEGAEEQEIQFFSTTDTPFDLILLLDLSGSTEDKLDLIVESAKRFIEAARPTDRIAIVTFTHESKVVSDFTTDKKTLRERIEKINQRGGSKVWDGLKFTYENLIKKPRENRRSAIVFMTDGVDNSLLQDVNLWITRDRTDSADSGVADSLSSVTAPSQTTFTELLETARQGETTIFPIYLDTETLYSEWVKKAYRTARRTLGMLAEETGGQYYSAKKIKDLRGIYERIINDLGKVYSVGYEPKNEKRDGAWRSVTVKIKNQPKLITRAKSGYYAR
jgi:VWFA-related protein